MTAERITPTDGVPEVSITDSHPIKPLFYPRLCIWLHNLFWFLTRSVCFILLSVLSFQLLIQYQEKNPTTITTYTDAPEEAGVLKVKICNSVFLDPDKIKAYDESKFSLEAYQFLKEVVNGNSIFNDSGWVQPDPLKPFFMISSRVKKTFLMDLDQFMLACFVGQSYKHCSKLFFYFDETFSPCFEGFIKLKGYGIHYAATIFLYFNPNKTLGRYTKFMGANVVVAHPEQQKPHADGFFIAPGRGVKLQ